MPVLQSGSTSALGHTYGVDEDVLLPVPAGSGSSRSSSESRKHNGVVAVVVEKSCRASLSPCKKEEEEKKLAVARVLGRWGGAAKPSRVWPAIPPPP